MQALEEQRYQPMHLAPLSIRQRRPRPHNCRSNHMPEGASIRWFAGLPDSWLSQVLERSNMRDGPWVAPVVGAAQGRAVHGRLGPLPNLGGACWYRLISTTPSGERATDGPVLAPSRINAELALDNPKPNPTRGACELWLSTAKMSSIRLSICDLAGRELAVLADGPHEPGRYEVGWGGAGPRGSAVSGVYFARLQTPDAVIVRRILIVR